MAGYYAAAPDLLARAPLDGGIEISREMYLDGIEGLASGKIFDVSEGFAIIDPPQPSPPEPEPEPSLAEYAAAKRRALAHGSTTVTVSAERDIPVWTDPESCAAILGLVVATNIDPNTSVNWKGSDGAFYVLDASEIVALRLGMRAYVQACFDAEAAVLADIANETITTTQQIDDAAWPPNG